MPFAILKEDRPMSPRLKGNNWFADFTAGGTRYREFGFRTKAEAEAWELEARAAIKRGKALPTGPSAARPATGVAGISTIRGLFDHVVKIRWSNMKSGASTLSARLFVDWVGPETDIAEALSATSIHEYVEHLQDERQLSGSTINRRLAAVSRLAKAAVSLGRIAKTPELPWQKEGESRIRWFTPEEEEQILLTLRLWGCHAERDLFIFLADTGARKGEAFKLGWSDISNGGRTATFWETKAGNHRSVPLTARAREALARRKAEAPAASGPFADINRHGLRSLWSRLRTHLPFLNDAVIHTFRHTCASRLVQNGVDLMRVRMWMGHKTVQTTLRYSHLAPKHLDDALRALEGGSADG
ncbi:site-specific integrase [Xanthobacter sp. YC-JY1]|uniref:tyrosine-type recombinase/integrase n=1 Tax=Xanthobacter sp. YC-JY1 TaxID=2419844 RepID=UPI001F30C86D|nr:site-specific integrase [Xanthobacter sp. YC-JY1]UJX45736.1 site-specific integrase [Xanthobacter sp. YC-JY1]